MKNLPGVCRMCWIMEWDYVHLCLRFILTVESNSVNVSKWCLMDRIRSKWHMSIDLLVGGICTCIFKGERVIVFKWLSVVHLVMCEVATVLQSFSIKLFRDVTTGPNLSLTTDHMILLHSLDFGCIQWSRCRSFFRLYLLLLLTLHPCKFLFHTQVMILVRSYCRWVLPLHYQPQ